MYFFLLDYGKKPDVMITSIPKTRGDGLEILHPYV